MLRTYRRGQTYWIRGTIAGQRVHQSARTADKEQADQVSSQLQTELWKRHNLGAETVLTFAQAIVLYIKAGKSRNYLEPLLHKFGKMRVADITAGAIKQAAVELYPDCTAATRNRQAITPMRAVINHAAEHGYGRKIEVSRFKEQRTIKPVGDLDWLEAFAAAAETELAALAWFLFLTGSRITPALQLKWADVDMATGTAIFRKPKGQSDRRAYLPPELVSELAKLPSNRPNVFRWRYRWSVYKPWRATCASASIPYIPPHSAGRHAFATGLLRAGLDPVTVARLGHWDSPRQVFDTYGHPNEDRTQTARLLKKGN